MDCKLENLLIALDDEIDKKCLKLKKKNQDQRNTRLFVCTCVLFIMIPIILIFAGINIVAMLFPIVCFFAISMFILSPIILGNNVRGAIQ